MHSCSSIQHMTLLKSPFSSFSSFLRCSLSASCCCCCCCCCCCHESYLAPKATRRKSPKRTLLSSPLVELAFPGVRRACGDSIRFGGHLIPRVSGKSTMYYCIRYVDCQFSQMPDYMLLNELIRSALCRNFFAPQPGEVDPNGDPHHQ